MRKRKKRDLITGLAVAILLMGITACSGSTEMPGNKPRTGANTAYTATYQSLPDLDHIVSWAVADEILYCETDLFDDEEGDITDRIMAFDLDTLTMEGIFFTLPVHENVSCLCADPDGMLRILTYAQDADSERDAYSLIRLDENGQEAERIVLPWLSAAGMDDSWVNPQSMAADADGTVYLVLDGATSFIVGVNTQGELLFTEGYDAPNGWIDRLCADGTGRVYAVLYEYGEQGSAYRLLEVSAQSDGFTGMRFERIPDGYPLLTIPGEGEEILISSGDILYRLNMADWTLTETASWMEQNVNCDCLTMLALMADGRILAFSHQFDAEDEASAAVILTPVNTP